MVTMSKEPSVCQALWLLSRMRLLSNSLVHSYIFVHCTEWHDMTWRSVQLCKVIKVNAEPVLTEMFKNLFIILAQRKKTVTSFFYSVFQLILLTCANFWKVKKKKLLTSLLQALIPVILGVLPNLIIQTMFFGSSSQLAALNTSLIMRNWRYVIHPLISFFFIRQLGETFHHIIKTMRVVCAGSNRLNIVYIS